MIDYYARLGVERSASSDEIKSAYHKKALKYHPDRDNSKDAEAKFKEIAEAYSVLINVESRSRYDCQLDSASDHSSFPFIDIFGKPAWGGGKIPTPGDTICISLTVYLKELFEDQYRTISITRLDYCPDCIGHGVKLGCKKERCSHCNGSGTIKTRLRHAIMTMACSYCKGDGTTPKKGEECNICNSSGRISNDFQLQVKIPKGMPQHKKLLLTEKGNVGFYGGGRGNVLIRLDHDNGYFERVQSRPQDLVYKTHVPFWKAALGGNIKIDHPKNGEIDVNISPGTQNNHMEKFANMGLPVFQDRDYGDLYVHLTIDVPTNLTTEEKKCIEGLKSYDEKTNQNI